ncbi:MAG: MFS transporter [Spirochaetaceae bacterium]
MTTRTALHWEGSLSATYLVLTQGPIFTALALYFGLDAVSIGVASSFPMAFQVFQLLTPRLLPLFRDRRRALFAFNAMRLVWIAAPIAVLQGRSAPTVFLLIFGISQAANALAGNTWLSMVRELVPESQRGRFMGIRSVFVSLVTILFVPVYSFILDTLPIDFGVGAVIGLSLFGSILSMAFLGPLKTTAVHVAPRERLATALADPNFRRLCVAFFYWNAVVMLASPFFSYHQMRNLGLPITLVSLTTAGVGVLSLGFYKLWGAVSDNLGVKSITVTGVLIVGTTPILWIFMSPELWPVAIGVDMIMTALGWAALNIVLIALPLELSKVAPATQYALYFAAGGIGGLLGSIAGGFAAGALESLHITLGGQTVFGLQLLFVAGGLLRYTAIPLFLRVETARYLSPPAVAMNVLALIARRAPLRAFELLRAGRSHGAGE